ncbi:hypothetical protein [Limnospira sp.]
MTTYSDLDMKYAIAPPKPTAQKCDRPIFQAIINLIQSPEL